MSDAHDADDRRGVRDDNDPGDDAGSALEFDEGRYLFCAVQAGEGASFDAEGIEGEPVSLVVKDGVAAVVQPVDAVYDSDDLTQVRSWLLDHQRVVDEAGERFGTPVPFRFDTIIRGDDATVREWLDDRGDALDDALASLAGRWEYRVRLRYDEAAVGEEFLEADDELQALAERAEEASEGTGFLLEKQYDQRLSELLERRRAAVEAEFFEAVEPHAVAVVRSGGGSGVLATDQDGDLETVAELSLLADREDEEAVGDALEPFAERNAYEVKYTGPWPPYSFAPEFGDRADDAVGTGDGGAGEP